MIITNPQANESLEQYTYRLCANKNEYGLSWRGVTALLVVHFNRVVSTDGLRHEWYGSKKRDVVEVQKDDGFTKVLIINDLHLPYVHDKIFEVFEDNKDADYILINGDFLDCKSCSFFDDFDKPSVEEELVIAHEFLIKVKEIMNPNVKIIANRGNHEYRYTRDILRMQEKQMQTLLNPNLLSMVEKGFTIYHRDKDVYYKPIDNFQYIDDFYMRMFDNLIVAHPLDFSGVEGSMCVKVADHFLNQGIAEKNDIIIFGHTHKFSNVKVNRRQGMFVIENGCLCQPHEYSKMGKLSYAPQNYGYTKLKFKEGEKIELNNIQFVHMNEPCEIKVA